MRWSTYTDANVAKWRSDGITRNRLCACRSKHNNRQRQLSACLNPTPYPNNAPHHQEHAAPNDVEISI